MSMNNVRRDGEKKDDMKLRCEKDSLMSQFIDYAFLGGKMEGIDRRGQIYLMKSLTSSVPWDRITNDDLGKVFGVSGATISTQSMRMELEMEYVPRKNMRPPLLNEEQKKALLLEVSGCIEREQAVTVQYLQFFLEKQFGECFKREAILYILKKEGFILRWAFPDETKRLEIPTQSFVDYFIGLSKTVSGVRRCLCFNLDESGYQKWADRKKLKVLWNKDDIKVLKVGVQRNVRRSTFLACISGEGPIPGILITPTSTCTQTLVNSGLIGHVLLTKTETGFINKSIFMDWVFSVFIPKIYEKRMELGVGIYEKAVLLIDLCSCHDVEELRKVLEVHNIILVPLVPHASHVLQPLDIRVFAVQKGIIRNAQVVEDKEDMHDSLGGNEKKDKGEGIDGEEWMNENWEKEESEVKVNRFEKYQIEILTAFHKSTSIVSCSSAFKGAGITFKYDSEKKEYFCQVDPFKCKRLREEFPLLFKDLNFISFFSSITPIKLKRRFKYEDLPTPRVSITAIKVYELRKKQTHQTNDLNIDDEVQLLLDCEVDEQINQESLSKIRLYLKPEPPKPKSTRGRKKGSKNKTPEEKSILEKKPKNPRGRPRKAN